MAKAFCLFQSVHRVMKAERLCREASIPYQIVPVPKEVSSECGMALEIDVDDKSRVASKCREAGIEIQFYQKRDSNVV